MNYYQSCCYWKLINTVWPIRVRNSTALRSKCMLETSIGISFRLASLSGPTILSVCLELIMNKWWNGNTRQQNLFPETSWQEIRDSPVLKCNNSISGQASTAFRFFPPSVLLCAFELNGSRDRNISTRVQSCHWKLLQKVLAKFGIIAHIMGKRSPRWVDGWSKLRQKMWREMEPPGCFTALKWLWDI